MGNKESRQTSASQKALDALLSRPSALQSSMFSLHATAHHGVPSNAKTLAFCGLQGILAVGTASGAVKLYGGNGLEVMLEGPDSASQLAVGVTHMKFTARQRLVVGYSDSSLRVFDLASGSTLCCVSDAWTTSVITSLETISYTSFPFFFVATDDGDIHVVHEETGRVSTYVIRPQDLPVSNAEGIIAMASHPRDSNLLLLAYDTCPAVLLWDFAKRKVVREFALSGKVHKLTSPQTSLTPSDASSADGQAVCNSPQSLSWHSSGKRFVVGYKQGGFAVFRADKSHGLYRYVAGTAPSGHIAPVKQVKWICAPPTSRQAALPGAIVVLGGRLDPSESNLLAVVYPPNDGRSSDDTLVDLFKSEKLAWHVATIESVNHAEIATFETAQDQIDYCTKMAPLSLILLSGNPLDGCLPSVSVQCLPCFVKLCDGDKEEWEWRIDKLPGPAVIPPLLQLSPLRAFALVNLTDSDSVLQDDLLSTWDLANYNPMASLMESGDFEWPINGGSVLEPMLKGFLATSGVLNNGISPNSMILLTGHENGHVLFWEARTAGDRASKGAIRLLHVVDVPLQMSPAPVNPEITCLTFCADSRTLVVGFTSGEIVVLEFELKRRARPSLADGEQSVGDTEAEKSVPGKEQNPDEPRSPTDPLLQGVGRNEAVGFRTLFSIHVHTEPISKLVVSSSYGFVAIADTAGMVSLVEIKSQNFQLVVSDIAPSCDESMLVDSLLMSELVQTTEIPGSNPLPPSSLAGNNRSGGKGSPGKASVLSDDAEHQNVIQHHEVIPVLFIGRGSGKLEMYHVHSATKMGETLVDPEKVSSLSSVIMVRGEGKRVSIPGHKWTDQCKAVNLTGDSADAVSSDMVEPQVTEGISVIQECEKVPGDAAEGLTDLETSAANESSASDGIGVDTKNVAEIDQPRFLVCTCGRWIHVVQATVPRAAEIAMGPKEVPAQPLASIELQGSVLVTSVIRVPFGEGVEDCLAVIDQSDRVYILSLLSLKLIWKAECCNLGLGRSGLVDGILADISYGGELVLANNFGEIERFSIFAEPTATESAMLERLSVKTRLHLPERITIFDQTTSSATVPDSGKKRGIADAGKMFKKLVLAVTQEATDLNKVFQFSTEEDERKRLMGDRSTHTKDAPAAENATAKTETGLNATKDALMQAHQRLAERGEKLNDLGLKTEQMKKTSEDFYQTMKAFNEKNANKKWYEF